MTKRILLLLINIAILLVGCHSEPEASDSQTAATADSAQPLTSQEIISLYKEVDSLNQNGKMDRGKMQRFVNEAVSYAGRNIHDTLSPHFLLYAGITEMQVAFSTADERIREDLAQEALNILEKLRQNYPDYRNAIYAYYYKAQIYENLGKIEEAAKTYRDLVQRFPDTELGKSIATYVQTDGYKKSAEELYQRFQK